MRTSAIVCTHNRGALIGRCLRALARQHADPNDFEILVVDNASTDDTAALAGGVRAEIAPVRLRVVHEPELGLSAARNTAVREARGAVLAFIDDDAEPTPDWLLTLTSACETPGVWAAGGPIDAGGDEGDWPAWLSPRLRLFLSEWDCGPEPLDLHYDNYPRGVNMAIRREAFRTVGGFSTLLGRKGAKLLSYEEIELSSPWAGSGGVSTGRAAPWRCSTACIDAALR